MNVREEDWDVFLPLENDNLNQLPLGTLKTIKLAYIKF